MKNFTLLLLFTAAFHHAFALAPVVSAFSPTTAYLGTTVTITGTSFTTVTAVSFGGTPAASFTIVSATQITAVVAAGSPGLVQVTNTDGSGTKAGFNYVSTSGIITDFGGYWPATGLVPNPVLPDSSHNLLAFTYNGQTWSTGANNTILNNHSVSYIPGNFKALPVAGIAGITSGGSTYLALGRKVDGSANVANTPAVSSFSVKNSLVDGLNGLDMGTGVTNLPATAILTFQIVNITTAAINDAEPDILLTQIAQPVSGNDQFSFIDASGNVVGNTLTQDMTLLPLFGTYTLDLFNLTPSTPYNSATAYSAFSTNTTREIRLTGLRLSDFGITAGNVSQVKALRITPSGNSDYAFIGYNADAINLPPNITQNTAATSSTICSGGTATLAVIAAPAAGGTLAYAWQESVNGGGTWTAVTNGGNYSGATTDKLNVANAASGNKYRAVVTETGNPTSSTSADFTIVVSAPAAPAAVSISGTAATCLNTAVQLTAAVTGGSNLFYVWQTNASGSYVTIADASLATYTPPVNQTGTISYRVTVTSGSGCGGAVTATPFTVTVTGIASTAGAAACSSGALTLSATATSGIINWYADDATATVLFTGNSFTTPVLTTTTAYYAAASGCAAALRVPVVATIYPATVGGTVAGGTTVTSVNNSTTLTLGGYTGSILKWQSSTDGFNAVVTDIANTTNQLTVNNLAATTAYRTVVKSGTCANAFSAPATITMGATLPIQTGSIKAVREQNNIRVQWTAYSEQNTTRYELERSTDGISYTKIYTATAVNSGADVTYNGIDQAPAKGYNFYRIREVLLSGQSIYSASVKVLFDDATQGITLFPNPVTGGTVTILFSNMDKGMYYTRFFNSAGQLVYQSSFIQPGGSYSKTMQLPPVINSGMYSVEIYSMANGKKTYPLMVLQ